MVAMLHWISLQTNRISIMDVCKDFDLCEATSQGPWMVSAGGADGLCEGLVLSSSDSLPWSSSLSSFLPVSFSVSSGPGAPPFSSTSFTSSFSLSLASFWSSLSSLVGLGAWLASLL